MESINCPLCQQPSQSSWIKVFDRLNPDPDKKYNISKCECGFIFLNPRHNEDEVSKFYQSDEYDPHASDSASLYRQIYKMVMKLALFIKFKTINQYVQNGGLLDIGGGSGDFCRYLKDKGWNATMLDTSENARRNAETLGIATISTFSQIQDDIQYDLITMWHSLEHIHDLESLFENIRTHLKPNGYLIIAVPNILANEQSYYADTWAPFDAPRHLYHFSPETLKQLLDKNNFKIIQSLPLYQDTPYNILQSLPDKSVRQILKALYVWMSSWAKIFFKGNYFSSSMEVVCTIKS